MCLKYNQKFTQNDELVNTREMIKKGISIRLKNKQVIVENQTSSSVFWIKPSLTKNLNEFIPNEIKKGRKMKVFDFRKIESDNNFVDTNVVNLSFGKQWNSKKIQRPSIEFCPCWISINFNKKFCF